ncbi:laminin subunit beta-3 isoform X1 [Silurus meridionalis]|uniref:laminin subunit beta-3 isoform X1 n=1 Tax=Silurus meridionalis TaxID=175797 RepID=UPI001EEA3420|nr:laminin subunit beta-3 isoform X1 [Silurus meridionalis]
MKTLIILQITAALAAVCMAQQECVSGACYPPLGDLLKGRETVIRASSTCGLTGIEVFCTPLGQWKMKCCPCDSRTAAGRNTHTIHNVLSKDGPERWWQSKKDVSPVTIELDLKQLFHIDNLLLYFKGPRPDALVIERTSDWGRTWAPVLYMATECESSFPHILTMSADLDTPHCYTLPSNTNNPYQDQRVYFHPMLQYSNIAVPNEQKIERLSGYTGLRVNLTQFGAVPYTPGRRPSRFYALKEIKLIGSCFCHGHADQCLPDPTSKHLLNTEVHSACDCQHNTVGVNCERCADLYNDLPWKPAERDNTHTCKRCECNNHAQRCRFDPGVYERSGRRSGGVCEECTHHTTGTHCERCTDNYYRNPGSSLQKPDACLRCQCDSAGSEGGRQCDEVTGACLCKENVGGARCERCKAGHYGLSSTNPLGCSKCSCSAVGSLHSVCDALSGQCVCKPNVVGRSCDRCAEGFWNLSSGCLSCDCDLNNAIGNTCDQLTGQCVCRPGFGGRTCSSCPENMYGDSLTGCRPCLCDRMGSVSGVCDRRTGVCVCKPGVVGDRCNMCGRGHCVQFPNCPVCSSCFFTLDAELQNLTLHLRRLTHTLTPTQPPRLPTHILQRITDAQQTLQRITNVLQWFPDDRDLYDTHTHHLHTLRSELDKVEVELRHAGVVTTPDLEEELHKLQKEFSNLQLDYNTKKEAATHFNASNYAGVLDAVKNAFSRSTDSVKRADGTADTVDRSTSLRDEAIKGLNQVQPINTQNLQTLREDLATRPDLTPTAKLVCGSERVLPCTPQQCEGELCPVDGVPPCVQGQKCMGALPWSQRAERDTVAVKDKLQQLNEKITQAYTQIQKSQDSTNKVRLSAEELSNQVTRTRDDINDGLTDIKDFVNKLKDFLSEPASDPAAVQRVCDGVLGVKLPETVEALKKKLKEIQDVAASLPATSMVLKNASSQLQEAEKLLHSAKSARDTALDLQENTDKILESLNDSERNLADMEEKLQHNLNLTDQIQNDIQNVEEVLHPAEDLVKNGLKVLDTLHPLLEPLKEDVQKGRELAEDAAEKAEEAEHEANTTVQDLELLLQQLEKLKQNTDKNNDTDAAGKRLQTLQTEATHLIQDTADILNQLTDKEAGLRSLGEELMENSVLLEGLESRVKDLIISINSKVNNLSGCVG